MTIAAGFVCRDGVLLCADTEESYSGDQVAHVQKLMPYYKTYCHAGIAGAGHGHLIDYATEKITAALDSDLKNNQNVEIRLKQIMNDLYKNEFRLYPANTNDEKVIQLLVAVQFPGKQAALFSSDGPLVRRIADVRVIGTEVLKTTARELHSASKHSLKAAVYAGMYLIKEAKDRFTGVGGQTHILAIYDDNQINDERTYDMPQREKFFDGFRQLSFRLMVRTPNPYIEDAEFTNALSTFSHHLKKLRRFHRKMELDFYAAQLASLGLKEKEKREFALMQLASQKSKGRK